MTHTHLLHSKPLIQLHGTFCLQYPVEVNEVHPLFAVLVVNDVVVEGIRWVHTLLYSSFLLCYSSFSMATCAWQSS